MKTFAIFTPLRIGRYLAAFFLLVSLGMAITFVVISFRVFFSDSHTVELELSTRRPYQFFMLGQLDDVKRGFADGRAGKPAFQPNPDTRVVLTSREAGSQAEFHLLSETSVRWLRYTEANPWKRLGLYYAGASNRALSLSLLSVLFYGLTNWLLYRVLRDATAATPFTMANGRRLQYFTLLIAGIFLAQELAYGLIRTLIPPFHVRELTQPLSHYVVLNTTGELSGAVLFVALTVVAFVYRRGVELHQEAELTV